MSSPRIHFFLGAEFSGMVANGSLNLDKLSESFLAFKRVEKEEKLPSALRDASEYFSNITFYSEQANPDDLIAVAKLFDPKDIIIAASAGGHAANFLVEELAKQRIVPAILAFEAFGLEDQPGVVYFRQNGNPRNISAQKNQTTYEYKDDTTFGGGKMIGHAAYTIRPAAVGCLTFKKEDLIKSESKAEDKNKFLLIKNAGCDVGGKAYQYNWLVGRQDVSSRDSVLATDRSALVLNFGFIVELGYVVAKKLNPAKSLSSQLGVREIKAAPSLEPVEVKSKSLKP